MVGDELTKENKSEHEEMVNKGHYLEKSPSVLGVYFICLNIPSRKEAGYYIHSNNVCNAQWVQTLPK